MAEQSAPQGGTNRREHSRKAVRIPGLLIFGANEEACTVFDISPRGANISASDNVPINQPLRLKLTQHGEFVGRVVWRRGNRMGMRFVHLQDEPVSTANPQSTIRLRKRGAAENRG